MGRGSEGRGRGPGGQGERARGMGREPGDIEGKPELGRAELGGNEAVHTRDTQGHTSPGIDTTQGRQPTQEHRTVHSLAHCTDQTWRPVPADGG